MKTNITLFSLIVACLLASCSSNTSSVGNINSNTPKEVKVSGLSDIDPVAKVAPPGDISVVSKLTDSAPPK